MGAAFSMGRRVVLGAAAAGGAGGILWPGGGGGGRGPRGRGGRGDWGNEGRRWGGVNTCYVLAMYSTRAMLREAGADPDRPPRTFPELDELAGRLTRCDARGRIERAGFLPNVPPWWTYLWLILFGGRLYDPAGGAGGRALIDAPECIRALQWAGATARRYGPGATRAFAAEFVRSIHSAQDPFISGRVAM